MDTAMTEPAAKNIALLIDADNVQRDAIDPVLTVLAELGQVNIRRAYGNWAKPGLAKWKDTTNRFGIRPQQQFDLTAGKNATDMAMTIDAIDLLYQGKVDGFGIMSSDSDFTPLVARLRQDGLPVYCFGDAKTPEPLRTASTRFIDVSKLLENDRRAQAGGKADEPQVKDEDLIELLGSAWRASNREDGWARLQEMGQIAGNRSSFDVRNHGFKRLSDMIASMDNFTMRRGDDGQLFVKRVR
jgi:uncharacterized protein (TIGR00288 family)